MTTHKYILICLAATVIGMGYLGARKRAADRLDKPAEAAAMLAPVEISLEKQFTYDKHTLADTYPYRKTTRQFQWDKIKDLLQMFETRQRNGQQWATLQNYKNEHGVAPLVNEPIVDDYNHKDDKYGVDRYQAIPMYTADDLHTPKRYGRDGSLAMFLGDSADYVKVRALLYDGEWLIPSRYIHHLDPSLRFTKTIFVDKTNQNITTIEKGDSDGKWYIRSMNPATTGLHHPPFEHETPSGIFVVQEKKPKMLYTVDGRSDIAGFAPYASRFSMGAYVHGVPVNNPNATEYIEISPTIGTTPRSHMCVRNATSHAKYVYDWAPAYQSLVFVFE